MKRRWLHRIEVDDRMSPRTGLFLVYYEGALEEITLVLAARGLFKRWHSLDWDQRMAYARTRYWIRFSWTRSPWLRCNRRFWAAYGSEADPAAATVPCV